MSSGTPGRLGDNNHLTIDRKYWHTINKEWYVFMSFDGWHPHFRKLIPKSTEDINIKLRVENIDFNKIFGIDDLMEEFKINTQHLHDTIKEKDVTIARLKSLNYELEKKLVRWHNE